MPNRLLREGLMESEKVLSLPIEARWLFVIIILSADDIGLFEATEFKLARRADVNRELAGKLLAMLADHDLVRLYQVEGKAYGFIPRFRQRLQLKRMKHPAPPPALVTDDQDAAQKIKDLAPAPTVAQRLAIVSATAAQPSEAEVEVEKKRKISASPHPAKGEGRFPEFWDAWPRGPRRGDRKKCLEKWRNAKLDVQATEIIAHVLAIKTTKKWRDGYDPAPLRYLNGEQWMDEIHTGEASASDKPWARAE